MLHRRKNRWMYGLLACIVAISVNLATPTVSQAGFFENLLRGVLIWGVQSYQISNLSDAQEQDFGQQIHNELTRSGQVKLYQNQRVVSYINEIGQRLARQSTRPNLNYKFFVVEDDSVNAFATMGGYNYINTGLIKTAANEAELASVIGHEIGHIAAKHSLEQMRMQARNQGILAATGLDSSQIVQLGVAIAVDYPNSRSDETEADDLGFNMLTRVGYAPEAMASFMKKLMAANSGGGRPPEFLSTHPATNDRIVRLQNKAARYSGNPQGSLYAEGLNQQRYRSRLSPLL
ncbi:MULTISPECIES: M48 family metallopeptidase [Cyanophyceae]|uniref:M48 family metallopeptidase n=1 Tax=Cyanophyceae TaxID=3028117 RepID=UPI0004AB0EB0|nr:MULTISPECIES: M48 family metallopeptidase [Cyanophyceae]AMA09271.1 peptidase M48 [Picosynechococcus sp. PCC 73109]ANV90565.1 peptidase M48 [Picosynechococcus sp. PCC 8807]QCS50117.1 peptidase M48 [Picosynechococcus sp. PCC 11901]